MMGADMASKKSTDTTVRIDGFRRQSLNKAAFDVSMHKGEIYKLSDLIRYLIDNYLDDAVEKMKEDKKED